MAPCTLLKVNHVQRSVETWFGAGEHRDDNLQLSVVNFECLLAADLFLLME